MKNYTTAMILLTTLVTLAACQSTPNRSSSKSPDAIEIDRGVTIPHCGNCTRRRRVCGLVIFVDPELKR